MNTRTTIKRNCKDKRTMSSRGVSSSRSLKEQMGKYKFLLIFIALLLSVISSCKERSYYTLILKEDSEIMVLRSDNDFKVGPLKIDENFTAGEYVLGTKDDKNGIYKVQFIDTTFTPGRVTISIGKTTLDIMSRAVIVNNHEQRWE